MTAIEIIWYSFWTGAGAAVAWGLDAKLFDTHLALARFAGAVAGFVAATVLPRILVRCLIERPRAAVAQSPLATRRQSPLLVRTSS